MVSEESIYGRLLEVEDEIIELTRRLIRIPSLNPPGDMSDIQGFLGDYFSSIGLKFNMYEPEKGRITLHLVTGDGGGEYIHLNGHIDVVPIGVRDKWSVDPFSGEIIDGYIYGRGASDMKAGVAVLIKVFEVIDRYWDDLPVKIGLSIVPDEETGGRFGSRYLARELNLRPRYLIISEPSTIYKVEVGEKGIYHYTVRVEGRPAHAAFSPYIGDNAILRLMRIIKDLYGLTRLNVETPEDLIDVVEESGNYVAELFGDDGLRDLYKRITCNVGVIRGGDKVNVVAPWAEAEVDMRIPPGLKLDDLKKHVREVLDRHGGSIIRELGSEPNYTSPRSQLTETIFNVIREVVGRAGYHFVAGATDARHFRLMGCDAVIYGPGDPRYIHSYDERVKVDDIKISARVILKTIYRLVNQA